MSRRNEWRRGFFHKLMERVLCRPHPDGEPCVIRMWRSRLVWLWVITCVKWHNFECSVLIGPYYDEHVFSEGLPPACGAVFADCRVKRMWRKNQFSFDDDDAWSKHTQKYLWLSSPDIQFHLCLSTRKSSATFVLFAVRESFRSNHDRTILLVPTLLLT